MFRETQDEALLREFWQDEQIYPQWYRDANNAWTQTWEEHLDFCKSCWRIYANENSLVYVEASGNLHFAVGRNIKLDDQRANGRDLILLRDKLLTEFSQLFGWVNSRNWGLKRLFSELGFKDSGVRMIKGHSHGNVLVWNCYAQIRKSVRIVNN